MTFEDHDASAFPPVESEPLAGTTGSLKGSSSAPADGSEASRSLDMPGVQPAAVPVLGGLPDGKPYYVRHRWALILSSLTALVIIGVAVALLTSGGSPSPDQAQTALAPSTGEVRQVLDQGAQAASIGDIAATGQQASTALNAITQADTQVSTITPANAQSAARQALQGDRALMQALALLKDTTRTKQSLEMWTNTIRGQVVAAQTELGGSSASLQALNLSQPRLAIIAPTDVGPVISNLDRLVTASQRRLAAAARSRKKPPAAPGTGLVPGGPAIPQPAATARSCGSFQATNPGGATFQATGISATGISCSEAQSVIDSGPQGRASSGWNCPVTHNPYATSCRRGSQQLAWNIPGGEAPSN
jgi:hypothetical protein